jgi:uncharacterized secreted protein with C-terminal beta-propeller domain
MLKKISLFLTISLLTTLLPSSLLAQSNASFEDVSNQSLEFNAIQYLQENQIVQGYPDGSFKPDNRINRAEFTKIIIGSTYSKAEIDACLSENTISYPDVDLEAWYAPYICLATKENIVAGYPDGSFKPSSYINFAESSKIISNSFSLNSDASIFPEEDIWYGEFVSSLQSQSAIPTTIDSAENDLTRGDMSEIVYRVKGDIKDKPTQTLSNLTSQIGSINSCDALAERYQDHSFDYYYPIVDEPMMLDVMDSESEESAGAEPSMAESSADDSTSSKVEFSETNIQEAGVDEPDTVKTNGSHIFTINSNFNTPAVQITSVDEQEIELDSSILFSKSTPTGLFLNNDQLIVLASSSRYQITPLAEGESDQGVMVLDSESSVEEAQSKIEADQADFEISQESLILPPFRDETKLEVFIFDITSTQNPSLLRKVAVEGTYNNARLIDNQLLFVSNYNPFFIGDSEDIQAEELVPEVTYDSEESQKISECTDIKYLPNHSGMNFLVVSSLDTASLDSKIDAEVVIASSSNIYVSKNNMYLTQPRYNYERFTDFAPEESVQTNIFKFEITPSGTSLNGVMSVPGTPLNQFSMSEYQGDFRIATTTNQWNSRGNNSQNNLYIFDENLNRTGVLEGLAPGERIYSTRFIGEKAYMVTFREVDPLFVIDLSDSNNPKVLGELKIPGFSDYLHPYDENHLLGFGKDATLDGMAQGMKVSLFNIEDPTNPTQLHTFSIGDRGTSSELLYNHKALLFSKEKNIMAFPVSIYTSKEPGIDSWGNLSFIGALNLGLDITEGFEVKGKYTHLDKEIDPENYWDYDYNDQIQRILYIGENLYTISNNKIQSHSGEETLDTLNLITK